MEIYQSCEKNNLSKNLKNFISSIISITSLLGLLDGFVLGLKDGLCVRIVGIILGCTVGSWEGYLVGLVVGGKQ